MSKSFKAASSIGAAALVLSGAAMAVIDAAQMDQWSVSSGTIGATCDATWTCGDALVDKGFFQRMVTEGGITYFQTIITEDNASASSSNLDALLFSDESFVRTGNVSGILDKQRISQSVVNSGMSTTQTHFYASTKLGSGWAGDSLTLTQKLVDDADQFQTDFIFVQNGPSAAPTAKGMKITAFVPIEQGDSQDFVLVDLQGSFVGSSGNVTLVWPNNPGTMAWSADDRIQGIWIGQDLTQIVGQNFGFTSYDNKTTGTNDFISSFSLTDRTAQNWDTAVWGDVATQGTIVFTP